MLEGPLCDVTFSLMASLVDGIVGKKDLTDRGFLLGLTWCTFPLQHTLVILTEVHPRWNLKWSCARGPDISYVFRTHFYNALFLF